ncbi:MAG TPA: folylpolyglutamate synthase/dihydrofolate synthase family protein [Pyrinomonadaceae bacterium]|nr:folylpolyglutamate synthase/dihydrofolate synthase family protein [Pyrinomonadaceae bacterium]
MNFDESLAYLLALGNEVSAMKLGLENIGKVLAALGNPEKNYLKVQIAGTNGKGSTCAFLEAICVDANIKVGLTTSPHLVSITERIKIEGGEIGEKDFARQATLVREISERLVEKGELETVPTFFEQVTAIAVNYFAEQKIELAILETGLGGRFDATTAANAEIVGLTPIDYDHQNILGETLTKIAAEKAAIIRQDTSVIAAPQKREAENVIYGKCREVGVEPVWAIPNVKLIEDLGGGLLYLSFTTKKTNYKVDFWMQGKHQWTNATLAIHIAENLRDFNFKIPKESIENGLETAEHKGRLEFWFNADAPSILFDGAHNVAGAKALKEYLDEFIKQPITMIFGAMKDKDLREIAEILFPKVEFLIFTKPDNPRSMETSELMEFLPEKFDAQNVFQSETIEEALKTARKFSSDKNLICVTGSLYLVGEAQKLLAENKQQ